MDKKEFLFKLCSELYDAIDYLYGDSKLGEILMWFGSTLSKCGCQLACGKEQDLDEMFEVISEELEELRKMWRQLDE